MKKYITLALCLMMGLTGCNETSQSAPIQTGVIDYALTTTDGKLTFFSESGSQLTEIDLQGTKNADFIYLTDSGDIYEATTSTIANKGTVIYAIDRYSGKTYLIGVNGATAEKVGASQLNEKNIDSAAAYNGILYYSVKADRKAANDYTYIKPEQNKLNGIIDYGDTLMVQPVRTINTYVQFKDLTDLYLEAMNQEDIVTRSIEPAFRGTFELPADVTTWTASEDKLYFYFDEGMGIYFLEKNQVALFHGVNQTVDAYFEDGRYDALYQMGTLGEYAEKALLSVSEPNDMRITKTLELSQPHATAFSVDPGDFIHILFEEVKEGGSPTKLVTLALPNLNEVASLPVKYIPTLIDSHDGIVYLFNPNEAYFLIRDMQGGDFRSMPTTIGETSYQGLIVMKDTREDAFYYDQNGGYCDQEGRPLNKDGELINDALERVNQYGQHVDVYGRAINEEGDFIDRYNNLLDDKGQVIQYTKQADDTYRNAKGDRVTASGLVMIQDEDGYWVSPVPTERPPVKGFYDREGEFIIDPSYLKTYPDAYDYLLQHGESVIDTTYQS